MKLIFAQGNPEPEYSNTRHNIGFSIINAFSQKHDATWANQSKYNAFTTEISINNERVMLVKPCTYYNQTGPSAQKIASYYKIQGSDILVIHDDLALDFGIIRFRQKGRDAGNNGIKSLIAHLGEDFCRLRIGILAPHHERINDGDYVTSKFSVTELDIINTKIVPKSIEMVERFIDGEIKDTSIKSHL